jgi:ABC-type polysaccharide/polyol phosphate transport system ATPase subunit
VSSVAVSVQGLGKAYRVYPDGASRVVEALSFGRAVRHKEKWALRDVNFELERGTALGVVGANGAEIGRAHV